jgi:hypothetical protein
MISRVKVQFSEIDEPVSDNENAGCYQQRVVDDRKHVVVMIEGLVGEQLSFAYSTTIFQAAAAASGSERLIRMSAACTRRSRAIALPSVRRRRSVALQTRSPVARRSRHWNAFTQREPQAFLPPPRWSSANDHYRCAALQSSRSSWPQGRMPSVPSRPSYARHTGKLDACVISRPAEFWKPRANPLSGLHYRLVLRWILDQLPHNRLQSESAKPTMSSKLSPQC